MPHQFKKENIASWIQDAEPSEIQNLLLMPKKQNAVPFSLGMPDISYFPRHIYQQALLNMYDSQLDHFQYSPPDFLLKTHIVGIMAKRGVICSEDEIFITSGGQQGLSLLTSLLLNHNGHVLTEELIYPGMLQAISAFTPKISTVATDTKTGIDVDSIEAKLAAGLRPSFIYIVVDGNNPYGISLNLAKRIRLVELAARYGVPIIEDDPYGFIKYDESIPPLKKFNNEWVFYVGTFSKIFSPALRVGWLVVPKAAIPKLAIIKESIDLNIATFSQKSMSYFLNLINFDEHIAQCSKRYKVKRDAMANALDEYFPASINYQIPTHGIFIWVALSAEINSSELLRLSVKEEGTSFLPSAAFCISDKKITTGMRLNFSSISVENIKKGIIQLGKLTSRLSNTTIGE